MNGDNMAERPNPEGTHPVVEYRHEETGHKRMDTSRIDDINPLSNNPLRIWDRAYVVLAARLILGFVFVVASIDKASDPNAFAVSIGNYKLVGPTVSMAIATILPWIELLCGLFLIFGMMIRGSSLLILLMLVVFTASILSGIFRGLDISCGCFSRDPSVGKIGWMKVFENAGLVLLSLLVFFSHTKRYLPRQPHRDTP